MMTIELCLQARSEGAAAEPESTDSDSDDDSQPISCKNCQAKQPLFKARLIYKMCHGCYTYYCRYVYSQLGLIQLALV